MSSFVHDRRHIDAIATILEWLPAREKTGLLSRYTSHACPETFHEPQALGAALWGLNVQSVAAQYRLDTPKKIAEMAGEDWQEPYTYRPVSRFARPATGDPLYIGNALSVIDGYTYQIEGKFCESPAYHAVEQIKRILVGMVPGNTGYPFHSITDANADTLGSDLPPMRRLIG